MILTSIFFFSINVSLISIKISLFNPLLHRYSFCRNNERQLLKTLWEKAKLLVTSNISFSHNVLLLNQIIVSQFVHVFDIISLFAAEFEDPKIGILGKGLRLGHFFVISWTHHVDKFYSFQLFFTTFLDLVLLKAF